MPYGHKYKYRENGDIVQMWNGSSVNPFTVAGNYFNHGTVCYVRSGRNANSRDVVTCRRPTGRFTYEWRWVSVPLGRKLAYKVWSKRLKKYVFARRLIAIKRLVKVPIKSPVRPKRGLILAPNPLSYSGASIAYYGDPCSVVVTNGSSTLTMQGALWAPFLPFSANFVGGANADNYINLGISSRFDSYISEADAECIPRLYERVKMQSVNLAQALVEYRQTAKLFVDVIKRLVQFWLKLKTGNLIGAMGTLIPGSGQQLANDHLAIQYGIRPLLSDLEGIATVLAKDRDVVFDIIVRRKKQVPRALIWQSSGPSGITWFKDEVTSFGYVEVKYKYSFRISSSGMAFFRTLTELGFGNLNSLAWETIPFSFVVDWAIPIGNYLNNKDAFDNLEVVSATKTVFRKEYIDFKRTFGGVTSGYTTSQATTGFIAEKVRVDRTLTGVPDLPFPDFKDPVSKMHIANALALLSQLMKR